jgi:ArsR family transcriptional regulator
MKKQLSILKGLADKTRLRIIQMLFSGPHCVEEMTARLKMSQPRISRHLRILRESGLVRTRRDRRRIYYSLAERDDPVVTEILGLLEDWLPAAPTGKKSAKRPKVQASETYEKIPSPSVGELEDFLL